MDKGSDLAQHNDGIGRPNDVDIHASGLMEQSGPQTVGARIVLSGPDAINGLVGVQDAVSVLNGFQSFFQTIAGYLEPVVKDKRFNLPVSLSKGSLITDLVTSWWLVPMVMNSYWFAKEFMGTLGKGCAEHLLQSVFKGDNKNKLTAFQAHMEQVPYLLYRVMAIAQHVGGVGVNALNRSGIRVIPQDGGGRFVIINTNKESLEISTEELKLFSSCDPAICSLLVSPVRGNLQLQYFCADKNQQLSHRITITEKDKNVFYVPEDTKTELILPELLEGHYYELVGEINRISENVGNIGFDYKGHSIEAIPAGKKLAPYKQQMISENNDKVFCRVKISGTIHRKDINPGIMQSKPIMVFDKLERINDETNTGELPL